MRYLSVATALLLSSTSSIANAKRSGGATDSSVVHHGIHTVQMELLKNAPRGGVGKKGTPEVVVVGGGAAATATNGTMSAAAAAFVEKKAKKKGGGDGGKTDDAKADANDKKKSSKAAKETTAVDDKQDKEKDEKSSKAAKPTADDKNAKKNDKKNGHKEHDDDEEPTKGSKPDKKDKGKKHNGKSSKEVTHAPTSAQSHEPSVWYSEEPTVSPSVSRSKSGKGSKPASHAPTVMSSGKAGKESNAPSYGKAGKANMKPPSSSKATKAPSMEPNYVEVATVLPKESTVQPFGCTPPDPAFAPKNSFDTTTAKFICEELDDGMGGQMAGGIVVTPVYSNEGVSSSVESIRVYAGDTCMECDPVAYKLEGRFVSGRRLRGEGRELQEEWTLISEGVSVVCCIDPCIVANRSNILF